jgi:anti-sigma regulatory factor (Ser/Thr protein kinase)
MNIVVPVADASYVASARREVDRLAATLGFSEQDRGRVALVATELATNLARHGRGGEVLTRAIEDSEATGLELIAIDRGPGIANIADSLRDGSSTYGSSGTGLGAIRRQSEQFDIFSAPGQGTAVLARLWPNRRPVVDRVAQVGAVAVAKRGEEVCGDGMALLRDGTMVSAMVVDGLGHGVMANAAAQEACRLFLAAGFIRSPAAAVQKLHAGLRRTRGVAVGVVTLDLAASQAVFSGLGNIAGLAAAGGNIRRFVSMNGIAGHTAGSLKEFIYPCEGPGLVIVLHSDGVSANWSLDRYPGLSSRHASLIAAVLLRDCGRGRDDAIVLVIKRPP